MQARIFLENGRPLGCLDLLDSFQIPPLNSIPSSAGRCPLAYCIMCHCIRGRAYESIPNPNYIEAEKAYHEATRLAMNALQLGKPWGDIGSLWGEEALWRYLMLFMRNHKTAT